MERWPSQAEGMSKNSKYVKKNRIEKAQWAAALKHMKPCTDCKNRHPAWIMQWDHVRGEKDFQLANVTKTNISKERILAEIEKCELVCANCHAERTYRRRHNTEERQLETQTAC